MKCDLDCPAKDGVPHCCKACSFARKLYCGQHPELRDKWDDKLGFWTPNGCALPRSQRPKECNEYDCKDSVFVVLKYYENGKWVEKESTKVPHKSKDFVVAGVAFCSPEAAQEVYRNKDYGSTNSING